MTLKHLRSSTADKRPQASGMAEGQLAINTASGTPGLFFKDSAGGLVKVGPVHVGSGAPNASPASGGTSGNSLGEQWLDTSGGTYVFKIWDGSAWRSEAGEFVNTTGDTMTGALGIIAGSASTPGLFFSGDTNTGIYSPGADQVAVATNGTGRLFVDASGNVGVNTASPSATLNVVSPTTQAVFEGSTQGNIVIKKAGVGGFSLYSDAAGTLAFYDGNSLTERLRITSAGLVGVGTSSPAYNLDVAGSLRFRAQGYLYDTAGTSQLIRFTEIGARDARMDAFNGTDFNGTLRYAGANLLFETGTGAGVTERLRITSTGAVGIGTSAPDQPLTLGATNGYPVMSFQNSGTTHGDIGFNIGLGMVLSARSTNPLLFYTSSAERVRIDSSGRVGIGTTSPSETLHVVGSIRAGTTSDFVYANNFGQVSSAQPLALISNSETVFKNSSGNERARIDSSGRLLVGTSSASSAGAYAQYGLIKTQGNSAASGGAAIINIARGEGAATITSGEDLGAISFTDSAGNEFGTIICAADANAGASDFPGRLVFSTTADGASSPTERMRIGNDGNIGIGEAGGAGARLSVTSTGTAYAGYFTYPVAAQGIGIASSGAGSAYAVYFFNNGTNVGSIFTTSSATAYNTSSDYRLKENVTAVTDGITRLQQLKPSRFNFIADPDKTVDGFLAHEVQAVVPEAITGEKDAVDDEGNAQYQGIDQSKLVPLLTAALQEAIGEIESLKARLTAAGI